MKDKRNEILGKNPGDARKQTSPDPDSWTGKELELDDL